MPEPSETPHPGEREQEPPRVPYVLSHNDREFLRRLHVQVES
jgi:hypothetical protein